jgi:SOS-response transcriptional repressor LexA
MFTVMAAESFGALLKRLLQEKGMSQRRLALLSGVDREYINQMVNGKVQSTTLATARKLASGLGVSPSLFFGDVQSPETALSDLEVSIKAYIPVFGEVSAGEGIEPIDYVASTRQRAAPATLRAYRVKGLCLEPEIRDGDTVIVDTALTPQSGDLVVVIVEGKASVKRYKETAAVSEGKAEYKYLENNGGHYRPEDVHLVGVVTEVNRKMR